MNPNAPQGIARALITDVDHLSRLAHGDGYESLSAWFAVVRTELSEIERKCGAAPARRVTSGEMIRFHKHVALAVKGATGREPQALLDRVSFLASRLRPPRAWTLVGMPVRR